MDNTLEILFGSKARVRTMRLFLRNPKESFALRDIANRTKVASPSIKKELVLLKKAGFLTSRSVRFGKSRRQEVWGINMESVYLNELQALLLKPAEGTFNHLLPDIKRIGSVRLAILGGVFVNQEHARADILIVGTRISPRKLGTFIGNIEAESGQEVNCVAITPKEFTYRYDFFDRIVREMLLPDNIRLIDKMGI